MSKHKCYMCGYSGKVIKRQYGKFPIFAYRDFEDYCTCPYGCKVKKIENRMKEPGYVNPFFQMSDEEILTVLSRCSDV